MLSIRGFIPQGYRRVGEGVGGANLIHGPADLFNRCDFAAVPLPFKPINCGSLQRRSCVIMIHSTQCACYDEDVFFLYLSHITEHIVLSRARQVNTICACRKAVFSSHTGTSTAINRVAKNTKMN